MNPHPPKERKSRVSFKRNRTIVKSNSTPLTISSEVLKNYESSLLSENIDDLDCNMRFLSRRLNFSDVNKQLYMRSLYNKESFIFQNIDFINWIKILIKYNLYLKIILIKQKIHKSFINKVNNDIKLIVEDYNNRIN